MLALREIIRTDLHHIIIVDKTVKIVVARLRYGSEADGYWWHTIFGWSGICEWISSQLLRYSPTLPTVFFNHWLNRIKVDTCEMNLMVVHWESQFRQSIVDLGIARTTVLSRSLFDLKDLLLVSLASPPMSKITTIARRPNFVTYVTFDLSEWNSTRRPFAEIEHELASSLQWLSQLHSLRCPSHLSPSDTFKLLI
jgi:hypothetical protein